jgi:beta-lactamase class A
VESARHHFRHFSAGRHRSLDSVPKPSARPSRETLAGIGAVLSLVLATSVYAAGQAAVPSGAVPSGPRTASAPSATPAPSATRAPSATPATVVVQAAPTVAARPAPGAPEAVPPAAVVPRAPSISPELDAQLNGIIAANGGYQLGVALIDMADGAVHDYGVPGKFTAASTGKVLAAAAYYRLAETGQLSLDAPMGASTAGVQIRQMIQQSNNESWALILAAIGSRRLTDYAASIGIQYDRSYNTLTPAEMARTLWLLYTGQLLGAPDTAQLLSYMQNTNLETLIPAALPPDVVVFHKYGLLGGNLHDASILVRDGRAYAFVVYTLGANGSDMADRTRIIHELTRAVSAALF